MYGPVHLLGPFQSVVLCHPLWVIIIPVLPPFPFHSTSFHFIPFHSISFQFPSQLHTPPSSTQPPGTMVSDSYTTQVLRKVESKSRQLGEELSLRDLEVLKDRITFLWGTFPSKGGGGSNTTKWRHLRSRRIYEQIQDMDDHLFLAVLLSVNGSESAQTKFEAVVDLLRKLGQYQPYHFTLNKSTSDALHALSEAPGIASNSRYQRLLMALNPGQALFDDIKKLS